MTQPGISEDARHNRERWDLVSDAYQAKHASQLNRDEPAWGIWDLPERELNVLGDVTGKDVLEFGCGAAQWSIKLALRGARPVGLDNSARQLDHARRLMTAAAVQFPLVHSSAEQTPLPDGSFDIVFCDHGAMSFADPYRAVPEVARLLRPDGLFAFNMATPLADICWNEQTDRIEPRLHGDYFSLHRLVAVNEPVSYQLPYGEWIRLFRRNGLNVEDLIELQPPADATSTYRDFVELGWARRWPAEHIWRARKYPADGKG